MTFMCKTLLKSRSSYFFKWSVPLASRCYSYEGDGKTTASILNNNSDYGLMINSVSKFGFVLNNGMKVIGPMVIFPKTILSWNIASSLDMNEDSFSLFLNLEPKLDVFLIGLDQKYPHNMPLLQNIQTLFRKHKIAIEILPVYEACTTYNFLNSEDRYGAAALIPPKEKTLDDTKLKKISKQN